MNPPDARQLLPIVLGRSESIFASDMRSCAAALREAVAGSKVLVIGAAGSIGAAVVRRLAGLRPGAIDLVDLSENGLVELVRDLRSAPLPLACALRTYAIGLGSVEFEHFILANGRFDYVLNLAALKHVRAERDPFTLMRLLDTNVLSLHRALELLARTGSTRAFSVSSDKAVRPASVMGASKRWMERVLALHSRSMRTGSARFANVAFSDGSLLHGFLLRLAHGQPLSAPSDVRRYFISADEAAELCLLACFVGGNLEVFVPKLLNPDLALSMADVAQRVLQAVGLEPVLCSTEQDARTSPLLSEAAPTRWPCYIAASDTSGEKELEEFFGPLEAVVTDRHAAIGIVRLDPASFDGDRVRSACEALEELRSRSAWTKKEIVAIVSEAVPELQHRERDASLDERM